MKKTSSLERFRRWRLDVLERDDLLETHDVLFSLLGWTAYTVSIIFLVNSVIHRQMTEMSLVAYAIITVLGYTLFAVTEKYPMGAFVGGGLAIIGSAGVMASMHIVPNPPSELRPLVYFFPVTLPIFTALIALVRRNALHEPYVRSLLVVLRRMYVYPFVMPFIRFYDLFV